MSATLDAMGARGSVGGAAIRLIAGLTGSAGMARASATLAAGLISIAGLAIAADAVYPNAEAAQPLQPGASVPSVSVNAIDGSVVDLAKLVRNSGALLVFYRGGW